MNKTLLTLAIALIGAVATTANAAEADGSQWLEATTATKSRAQVADELQQARREGTVGFAGTSYKWLPRAKTLASRDEVKAEYRRALATGELAARGEAYDGTIAKAQRPAARQPRTLAAVASAQL